MTRRTLRIGNSGIQVEQLQLLLKKKGLFRGHKTTMFFGPITKRELIKYQKRANVPADGICGPRTWAKLLKVAKPVVNKPIVPPTKKPTVLRSTQPTQVSSKLISFIADFEGWFSKPYNDPVGHCTIGYGTLLHRGNCTAADIHQWGEITTMQGHALLKEEVGHKTAEVLKMVTVRLSQNELDALVSFAYNCGTGALASSTLLKKLNAGNKLGASQEFGRWVNADGQKLPGLVRRREDERRLFRWGFKAGSIRPNNRP